jgi:hypothetical protein
VSEDWVSKTDESTVRKTVLGEIRALIHDCPQWLTLKPAAPGLDIRTIPSWHKAMLAAGVSAHVAKRLVNEVLADWPKVGMRRSDGTLAGLPRTRPSA